MEVDQEHAAACHVVQQPVARPLRRVARQRLNRHLRQDIMALRTTMSSSPSHALCALSRASAWTVTCSRTPDRSGLSVQPLQTSAALHGCK